jgi:hypothetical protein
VGGHGAGNAGLAGSTPAASTSRAQTRRWSLAPFRRLPVQESESLQEIEYLFVTVKLFVHYLSTSRRLTICRCR